MTPLHYAAQNGRLETCQLLIDKGADVDARSEVSVLMYPLVRRCEVCKSRIITDDVAFLCEKI